MTTDEPTAHEQMDLDNKELYAALYRGLDAHVGLKYVKLTPTEVVAELEVEPHVFQPFGIVHGGLYCTMVESVGSVGGFLALGGKRQAVGAHNATDFFRPVNSGKITATGKPVHVGRSQQVWEVTIVDSEKRLVAQGRLRLANVDFPQS